MASTRLHSVLAFLATLALLGPLGRSIVTFIVDRITLTKRVPPREGEIKVIACGFCRSGTRSLKLALERLGLMCYHGSDFLPNQREHAKLLMQAATEAKSDKWQQVLRGYGAIADFPATCFYKQLMAAYPNAKVILNVRDPERWYYSVLRTIYRVRFTLVPYIFKVDYMNFCEVLVWQGQFKGRFEDKEFAIEVYKRHVEEVKSIVPKEKLLVYEVTEGWGPLCKFLEVDIPDTSFPHVNESSVFQNRIRRRQSLFAAISVVYVGVMWSVLAVIGTWLYQFHLSS